MMWMHRCKKQLEIERESERGGRVWAIISHDSRAKLSFLFSNWASLRSKAICNQRALWSYAATERGALLIKPSFYQLPAALTFQCKGVPLGIPHTNNWGEMLIIGMSSHVCREKVSLSLRQTMCAVVYLYWGKKADIYLKVVCPHTSLH